MLINEIEDVANAVKTRMDSEWRDAVACEGEIWMRHKPVWSRDDDSALFCSQRARSDIASRIRKTSGEVMADLESGVPNDTTSRAVIMAVMKVICDTEADLALHMAFTEMAAMWPGYIRATPA